MPNLYCFPLVSYLSSLTGFITLITGLLLFRKLDSALRIIVVYFFVICLVDTTQLLQAVYYGNNSVLLHIFTILEYSFLAWVFQHWQTGKIAKHIIRWSIPVFILIGILFKIYLEPLQNFDGFTASLSAALLIFISLYTLITILLERNIIRENYENLISLPKFWVSIAVLVYFSGNILTFAFGKFVSDWGFSISINVIFNLLILVGLLCRRHPLNWRGA
ncbi:MAG: hypothetical protein GF315_09105 [candidate division Zixibacteria bacterium]|nr:hypothetical protein [candidate division Zixibacteria bacterium]